MLRALRSTLVISCAALLLSAASGLGARAPRSDRVDRVALARVLLRDGLPERALQILDAPAEDGERIDVAELQRVRGLAATALKQHDVAADAFARAIAAGEQTAPTWLGLANAHFALERFGEALQTLERAPRELQQNPARHRLEARIHYRQGDRFAAFRAVERGLEHLPADAELQRQRQLLLVELGLFSEAIVAAREATPREGGGSAAGDPPAGLRAAEAGKGGEAEHETEVLAAALLGAGQGARALLVLEEALLRQPGSLRLRKLLAHAYQTEGSPRIAADVLRRIEDPDDEVLLLVAELYRRAGMHREAQHANARVEQQPAKLRQRLGLLLDEGRFHEAARLEPRLERLRLLSEDPVLYALAYAAHAAGQRDQAERLLGRLRDPEWFDKGNAIRQAIDACRREASQCE